MKHLPFAAVNADKGGRTPRGVRELKLVVVVGAAERVVVAPHAGCVN